MGNKIDFNPYTYTSGNGFNYNQFNNMSSPYGMNSIYDGNRSYGNSFTGDTFEAAKAVEPDGKIIKTGTYGIEKYNKLTESEKLSLRANIKSQEKIDDVLHLTNIIEENLKKRYPNGFKIVGIGRSPSLLMEILKAKGYDALSCPISNLTNGEYDIAGKYSYLKQLDKQDVITYKEAIESLGISADKIKASGKTTVFVDYTRTGNSLRYFQDLIARPEIGIDKKLPIEFLSLNKDLMPNKTMSDINLINKYWENLGIKEYSFMPKLNISELGKTKEILKKFVPNDDACKFILQVIDVIRRIK